MFIKMHMSHCFMLKMVKRR